MFAKFNEDTVYIFSKDKFIEDQGEDIYRSCKIWVDTYNNRPIEKLVLHNHLGFIGDKRIVKDWCEEVIDDVFSSDSLVLE